MATLVAEAFEVQEYEASVSLAAPIPMAPSLAWSPAWPRAVRPCLAALGI